jgi:hypothetical protein
MDAGSMTRSTNKYRARSITVDGIRFPSRLEANRYGELKLLERAGEISGLTLQPEYPLTVNGVNCGTYRADFRYVEKANGTVIEDTKGFRTPVYRLKKRIVEAIYGIKITEVGARK